MGEEGTKDKRDKIRCSSNRLYWALRHEDEFKRGEGSKECGIFEVKRDGLKVCQGRGVQNLGYSSPLSLSAGSRRAPDRGYAS